MPGDGKVHEPMILKMEKICRGYIDQLENGGEQFNIQNFMMMYIFGACNNTEYRTKLFDHWPTVSFHFLFGRNPADAASC